MTELHLVAEIDAPCESVFDAALDIDVHMAADPRTRAVAGVTSGPIGLGQTVTWRSPQLGLVWRMTSEITVVDRPHRFVDQMVSGPFRSWWHEHLIEATPAGCRLTDHVRYEAPVGPLGRLVDAVVLRRHLTKLLRTHQAEIAEAARSAVG